MRMSKLPTILALCLPWLLPAIASAQGMDEPEASGGALEGAASLSPPPPGGGSDAPTTTHTVERGDTLWDLSQRYLGSPWYWPKVWSYNPEIANPHWIYPGSVVRFAQGGEERPTQVEIGEGPDEPMPGWAGDDDQDRVTVAGRIGYAARRGVYLQATGFVTPEEIEASGRIVGSFAETEMLSFPNQPYAEFKSAGAVRSGEAIVVFRKGEPVVHPISGKAVGYLTTIVGAARVVKLHKSGMVSLSIDRQFDEIRRGDLLGPVGESLIRSVAQRPNERDIPGAFIVAGTTTFLSTFGEHSIVIIDKGSEDGVRVGNTFVVTRQHDGAGFAQMLDPRIVDERFPVEVVGRCMAFEVRARASTCLVTQSIRELVRGDKCEMRATVARSAMR